MATSNDFTFEISLSVLNHLGRNLYRSFITVLGEAISNSWDANAENVWIYIDKENNSLIIKDDGLGMSASDFQNKFLKIGYSKRKSGESKSPGKKRPYIGRKGIGKLALLSCADRITVISKVAGSEYVGGVIDNSGLDEAIHNDLTPDQYKLGKAQKTEFKKYLNCHDHGTLIYFENIKEGINQSSEYLKKLLALYFRFSLIDGSFRMFLNDEEITIKNLEDLAKNTQFLWVINSCKDPFVDGLLETVLEKVVLKTKGDFNGFIASVGKPRDLKVVGAEERVSIDLFANGRLREKDLLKYMPSARIVENYLFGQIHFDGLDDKVKDRFSSSREGIVAEDPKFRGFIDSLRDGVLGQIIEEWDAFRVKHRKPGDPENQKMKLIDRKSMELYFSVSDEFSLPDGEGSKEKTDEWIDQLADDAKFNFGSYAECFVSENLVRRYIQENGVKLSPEAQKIITEKRKVETENKQKGNCNIDIRQNDSDTSYLDLANLANLVDKQVGSQNCLPTDAKEYKPIRDALMHTALLTSNAKVKLTSVFNNIRGRVKTLLAH